MISLTLKAAHSTKKYSAVIACVFLSSKCTGLNWQRSQSFHMSNLLCSSYIFHTVTVASVSVWFVLIVTTTTIIILIIIIIIIIIITTIIITSHENDYTRRDWCTWNYFEECKGLVWEVESAWRFWKCTVVGYPLYCSYLVEDVVSLSCGKLLYHGYGHPENTRELKRITQ